jgi:hypothetical protein
MNKNSHHVHPLFLSFEKKGMVNACARVTRRNICGFIDGIILLIS